MKNNYIWVTIILVVLLSSIVQTSIANAVDNKYNIEQAISDKAQLNTLAFSGLAFLTGNLTCDSFLPPGKLADFFGFQYLRDTTQAGQGHSTDFLTNAANNVLFILNNEQKNKMAIVAKNQSSIVNDYANMRYPLMVAFRRQLTGDLPNASYSLSKTQVMAYSAKLYGLDNQISLQRAKLFAEILGSLNTSQKQYLDNMVTGGFASWPALPNQATNRTLTGDENVLVMTYASEMFGWYAGNIEADTYFCPERHADYFGGFYIKDAPAIGNPGYTIDETITGNSGESFLAALNVNQKAIITSLVEKQKTALLGIVEHRRAIATELRLALQSRTINETKVAILSAEYGALDGEISYYYAAAFSEVIKTITPTQMTTLNEIRNLDNYTTPSGKIYLFSQLINQPQIQNTDFLFEANNQTFTVQPSQTPLSTTQPNSTPALTANPSLTPSTSLPSASSSPAVLGNDLPLIPETVFLAAITPLIIAISLVGVLYFRRRRLCTKSPS